MVKDWSRMEIVFVKQVRPPGAAKGCRMCIRALGPGLKSNMLPAQGITGSQCILVGQRYNSNAIF